MIVNEAMGYINNENKLVIVIPKKFTEFEMYNDQKEFYLNNILTENVSKVHVLIGDSITEGEVMEVADIISKMQNQRKIKTIVHCTSKVDIDGSKIPGTKIIEESNRIFYLKCGVDLHCIKWGSDGDFIMESLLGIDL